MKYQHPRYLFRRFEVMRRIRPNKYFLEIGPGNLDLAQDLLTKFASGTLIDFNDTDVEQIYNELNDKFRRRLKLVIADFFEYEFNLRFDCVVACEVLEHIRNDRLFLKKINELLVDGGQLILSVPSRQKYWSRDDEVVGHFRRYEKAGLIEKMIEAGFSQINIVSYGFPFQNLVRLARITLARFHFGENAKWEKKKQSQQSAFLVRRSQYLNLVGVILNKYTIYPFNLFASLFNNLDLGEGYVVSAIKS